VQQNEKIPSKKEGKEKSIESRWTGFPEGFSG
jgi:hypothetical protein